MGSRGGDKSKALTPALLHELRSGLVARVELWGVGLKASDAALLSAALASNGTLTHLDLGGNPDLGDAGAAALAPGLKEARALINESGYPISLQVRTGESGVADGHGDPDRECARPSSHSAVSLCNLGSHLQPCASAALRTPTTG